MNSSQDSQPHPADDPVTTAAPATTAPACDDRPPAGRLFRLRSVIAVAAAGFVLGATGGATVTALVDGDNDRSGHFPQPGERGGERPAVPPGGQVPGTSPEQDAEEDAPSVFDNTSTS